MLNRTFLLAVLTVISISTSGSCCSWSWPWSDTTRYNGACTLENKTYKSLEIHGAATLRNLNVSNTLLVSGSTKWENVTVQGSVTIRGALDAISSKVTGNTEISGGLKATDLEVSGPLDVKGNLHALTTKISNLIQVKGSIDASNSKFEDIIVHADGDRTYRFNTSPFKNLTINGQGKKAVVLTNLSPEPIIIDAIIFENKGGIVKINGSFTIKKIVNGTVEKEQPATTISYNS